VSLPMQSHIMTSFRGNSPFHTPVIVSHIMPVASPALPRTQAWLNASRLSGSR